MFLQNKYGHYLTRVCTTEESVLEEKVLLVTVVLKYEPHVLIEDEDKVFQIPVPKF